MKGHEMQTTTQTVRQALDAAGADLAQQGLTLVLSAGSQTTGDAWCDATDKHGLRVALIHLPDGVWSVGRPLYYTHAGTTPAKVIYVSYPWCDVDAGKAIQQALVAQGFTVDWDGDGTRAIQIKL